MDNLIDIEKAQTLEHALEIAMKSYKGILASDGLPYIFHVIRVALKIRAGRRHNKTFLSICALLYPVLEDEEYTLDKLRSLGFSEPVIAVLDVLSRNDKEDFDTYLKKVAAHSDAKWIKLAALEDNMLMYKELEWEDDVQHYQNLIDRIRGYQD